MARDRRLRRVVEKALVLLKRAQRHPWRRDTLLARAIDVLERRDPAAAAEPLPPLWREAA